MIARSKGISETSANRKRRSAYFFGRACAEIPLLQKQKIGKETRPIRRRIRSVFRSISKRAASFRISSTKRSPRSNAGTYVVNEHGNHCNLFLKNSRSEGGLSAHLFYFASSIMILLLRVMNLVISSGASGLWLSIARS